MTAPEPWLQHCNARQSQTKNERIVLIAASVCNPASSPRKRNQQQREREEDQAGRNAKYFAFPTLQHNRNNSPRMMTSHSGFRLLGYKRADSNSIARASLYKSLRAAHKP